MTAHVRQLRATLEGKTVGRLVADARAGIVFAYEPSWLAEGFDIAPHTMAFVPGPQKAPSPLFEGLHGVFADSLPDGWGLLLMDRALRRGLGWVRHEITLLDRLAYIGPRAMGALSYEPMLDVQDDEHDAALDLGRLAADAEAVMSGTDAEVLGALLLHGGSPGGARPKVTLARRPKDGACVSGFAALAAGFEHWIVKFPAHTDSTQSGRIEYAYSLLAKKAGVEMPPTALIPVAVPRGRSGRRREQHFFAVQRFDRGMGDERDRRVHMLSLSGHLYATHRAPSVGYDTLLAATLRLTRSLPQVIRAFRLMAFNLVMHNRDDHTRNFAFLHHNGGWTLSPAYDLTFSVGLGGQHMSDVRGSGDPTRDDALAVGRDAGINDPAAILDEVVEAAGAWGRLAARCDVGGEEAKTIAAAINRMRRRLGPRVGTKASR